MKPEELMVGDWVCAYNIYPNTKPLEKINLKIKTPLNSYGFIVATYGNRMAEYEDDDIEPIPITPEILEKNGFFLYLESPDAWVLQWTTYQVKLVSYAEGRWSLNISSLEDGSNLRDKTIRYVHQLQHFMRDFEIEKEIELCN